MGCGAVLNSERCVELALNVAIDPERITEHAVAVQVSTEGGLQPVAVPYGRFFVGVPRGYDTEGRGDRSRSVVVAGTSIPLVDALALSLLPHEQVLSGLRQSVAAWAALSDSALLALRPTIRVALNGDVLGGDGPATCSANANARCTLRVFERPSGARIADCAFDQSGLCGESLRARRIWGGLALEFTYSTGTAQAPALAEWTLRQEQGSIAAGDRTWSALRRIRCIAGVTPTSACVDGDVLALAPHEMIAGQFVEKPARFGIAIESSLGAAFSVASAAQLLGAAVTTLDGDAWSERPVATHFALRPSTASGWPLGAWFDRFECVSRETLIELGARRFDLQGVTQNLVGDHLRRAANDVRTFHVSPVGATSGELSADWQSSPAPMLTVRVMPAVAGEVAEVTATVADLRWTLPRTAGSTTQFATRLTGIVESFAAESEGELTVEARSSNGDLIGFDRVMLRLRTRRADSDADGVLDVADNCAQASNALQEDLDRDGQGDECDDDIDGDTLSNADERRDDTDPRLADTDRDGVPDNDDRAAGGAADS